MSTPKKLFRMDAAIGSSIYNSAENTNFNVGDVIYTQDINTGQCMGCSALTQEIADLKNMITQQNVAIMEAFAELRGDFNKILAETETNKNIMDNFPIQNLEDLEKMEKKICPENQAKYIQTFSRSLKGKLTKTLTKILDSKLLLEVNVEGIQNKERLKNYKKFYNALIEAIDEADPEQALRKAINTIKKRHHHKHEWIHAAVYLAVYTRPDIAFAVNFLSQFNSNYKEEHWKAAKRVLRYLNGTQNYGLHYIKTGSPLYGVADADWAADSYDRRSYSGFGFILGGAVISWEARKQKTVALSSTESEYMAISDATKEALYLKAILSEIGVECGQITIYNDNQSAQKLIEGFGFNSRTKHIDVRHHFVREKYQDGSISLKYMSTDEMSADMLTKGLNMNKHFNCASSLGLNLEQY